MIPKGFDFESLIFDYIDQFKFIFFPEQWNTVFLDYSKNEMLTLLYISKNKTANMTEIADYINAPLNTATGIIGRLEKKQMVERRRGDEDRRVVNIVLTKNAEDFISEAKKVFEHYFIEVYKALSDEEKSTAFSIFNKIVSVLKNNKYGANNEEKTKKVKRIIVE